MAWVRTGGIPREQRASIIVNTEKHPELAQFIFKLPYREGNKALVELLEDGLKARGLIPNGQTVMAGPTATAAPVIPARTPAQRVEIEAGPAPVAVQVSAPDQVRVEQPPVEALPQVAVVPSPAPMPVSEPGSAVESIHPAGEGGDGDSMDLETAALILEMERSVAS